MSFRKRRAFVFIESVPCLLAVVISMLVLSGCGGGAVTPSAGGGSSSSPVSSSSYSLVVEMEGAGNVTSTPGGIACSDSGGSCDATYANGTSVTLVASPAEEYEFQGWVSSGDSCSNGATCTASSNGTAITVASTSSTSSTTRTLRAIFARRGYTLSVSVTGGGTVTSTPSGISCGSDCTERYTSGTSVTLTAAPASGYTFTGWSGSGISCPGTGSCTVAMTATRAVAATFSPVAATTYLLQVAVSGSGTVASSPAGISCGADCGESYASGTSVILTATPASGYTFGGWNGGGCTGTGSCTVSMTAARTVTASFVPTTYLLSVSVSGSGSVSSSPTGISCGVDCTEAYNSGTAVTLTASPTSGYTFSGWSGGGCAGTGTCTVTMSAARSVTATFIALRTLSVSRSGSGTVTSVPAGINCGSTCAANYTNGTSVTLTATPASGYVFGGWGGACSGVSTCTVSMTAARSVSASFTANTAVSLYRVDWDAVPDERVTAYRLYYSTAPLTGTGAQTVNVGNVTTFTFDPSAAGLSIGTTVYFAVTALGDGLESPLSESVSVVLQ